VDIIVKTMQRDSILENVKNIKTWKKHGERAPHKPLLLLLALGKMQQEKKRLLSFSEVEEDLKNLLESFGPSRKSYHPEQPFVRLPGDGLWELSNEEFNKKANKKLLREADVKGGFPEEVYQSLAKDPELVRSIAEYLLESEFPDTLHEDILMAVGLDLETRIKRKRDPKFRDKVLKAYEYRCAVCGFDVRLKHNPVALEAAHIKWHQVGGPDSEENGIALCSMHHKLFDRGVFTLNKSGILLVSEEANGSRGLEEWLIKYHDKSIREPIHPNYFPEEAFVKWHVNEVFKDESRYRIGG